jgi:hypothetical protein
VAAEWKRHGYTIDGGIHFYMGYRPGGPDHFIFEPCCGCMAVKHFGIRPTTAIGQIVDFYSGFTISKKG